MTVTFIEKTYRKDDPRLTGSMITVGGLIIPLKKPGSGVTQPNSESTRPSTQDNQSDEKEMTSRVTPDAS